MRPIASVGSCPAVAMCGRSVGLDGAGGHVSKEIAGRGLHASVRAVADEPSLPFLGAGGEHKRTA